MSLRNLTLLLALLWSAACGSAGTSPLGTETRVLRPGAGESIRLDTQSSARNHTLPTPVADAWDALWAAYRSLEIPITGQDPDTHMIENNGFRARRIDGRRMSEFFMCGQGVTGSVADTYQVTLVVHTSLEVEGASMTTLYTQVDATAEARDTRSGTLHCESRGRLEELIAERVTSFLPTRD